MKTSIIILFATITLHCFSQSGNYPNVDSKEYELMKKENKIPRGLKLVGKKSFTPTSADLKLLLPNDEPPTPASTTSCSCYIQPDSTYTLALLPNDDGSTNQLNIPFNFCLYGTTHNTLYINNNGNVSFGTAVSTFSSSPFPDPDFVMVAPFWADVDTRGTGQVKYKITPTAIYVNWVGVGYYDSEIDKVNTFQLIITNGTDPILPAGNNIAFCYGDMQWTTGSVSQGINGFGGIPATVGVNQGGFGGNYIQMGQFDQPGLGYDGGYGNSDGVDWLDNKTFYFNSCSSTNIAPIASGLNNCDTLRICSTGDTLILNGLFLAPEIGQNTVVTVNLNGTPDASVLSISSGNSATALVQIIASLANAGNQIITFTATDDGTPAGITIVNVPVFIDIDTTGASTFNPTISGDLQLCEGANTTLSVMPTTYNSYTWSTGSIDTLVVADSGGVFWVTATRNGCYKTIFAYITEHSLPTPVIVGNLFPCNGSMASLTVDSLIYSSYNWTTADTNDSIDVGAGTYVVVVVDSNGCTGISPPVMVVEPLPVVITGILAVCNGDLAVLTTTNLFVNYNWSNSSANDSIFVPTGIYSVTVTDINSCVITSPPFNVNTFDYSLALNGIQPYCSNQSITLTAVANPSANAGYLWSTASTTSSININSGGNYSVTVAYPNGCIADTSVIVASPNSLPTPIISGILSTCKDTSTILSIDSIALYTSYVWSNSGTTNSIAVISGSFTVTVTDLNGCIGVSPSVVVINSNPTVTILGSQQFCLGDSTLLTANPSIPFGASYLWSNSETTQSINVEISGTYYLSVNYSNSCNTGDTITITQYDLPVANFTEFPINISSTTNPVTFTDLSTIPSGTITNWVWNFGDSTSSFLQQPPPHIYSKDGTYFVTFAVQSNNGCWDTVMYQYTIESDLEIPNVFTPNGDGENDLLVFKNLQYFRKTSLAIYDRWGIKVYESSDYQNNWNGGGHSDGVYYYELIFAKLKDPEYGFFQIIR